KHHTAYELRQSLEFRRALFRSRAKSSALTPAPPTPRGVGGAGVQAELFAREPEPQLVLPLEGCAAQFREPVSTGSEPLHIPERQDRKSVVTGEHVKVGVRRTLQ